MKINNRIFFSLCLCSLSALESGAVVTDAITNNDNETAAGNVITLGTPEIVAGNENTVTPNSFPPPPPYGSSSTPQSYIQVKEKAT